MIGMPQPVSAVAVAGAKFGPRGIGYFDYKPQPAPEQQYAADDYAGGFIRFANGAGLQVESFWAAHQPDDFQIELFGTEAGVRCYNLLTVYRTIAGTPVDSIFHVPKDWEGVWNAIAAHFVECIPDGVPCQAPLCHGLIVQEMMEAVLESAETGREVALSGESRHYCAFSSHSCCRRPECIAAIGVLLALRPPVIRLYEDREAYALRVQRIPYQQIHSGEMHPDRVNRQYGEYVGPITIADMLH
jgi:hypothetical protein